MSLQLDEEPRSLRQINCDARRDRILHAAREVLSADGIQALTMRRLARVAGLSVTTLYNLIGGREAIVGALVVDAMDRMDGILEREAPLEDPLARCRAVVTVSVASVAGDQAVFRPLAMSAPSDRLRSAPEDRRVSTRAAAMQSTAIRAAIQQGLLRDVLDPDQLGSQIYHGWEAAFYQWGLGILDEAGFRARALYGLYVALLGVASEQVRPAIEAELRTLESELSQASNAMPQEESQRA